jgi:hypothetical protein
VLGIGGEEEQAAETVSADENGTAAVTEEVEA